MYRKGILDKHWFNPTNYFYNLAYSNQSLFLLEDGDKLTFFSLFLLEPCIQIKYWALWVINIILDSETSSDGWL